MWRIKESTDMMSNWWCWCSSEWVGDLRVSEFFPSSLSSCFAADQPCRNSMRPSHHMTTASFTETPPDEGAWPHSLCDVVFREGTPPPPWCSTALLWAFCQNLQKNNEFPFQSDLSLSEILKFIMSLQEAVTADRSKLKSVKWNVNNDLRISIFGWRQHKKKYNISPSDVKNLQCMQWHHAY